MKKLMIAATAVAMVGGAFARPLVYDYKASVKHTYLKAKNIKNLKLGERVVYEKGAQLYLKYTKSSSLQGYLIQDDEAVLGNRNGFISYDFPGEEATDESGITGTNFYTRVCDVRRITKNDAQPGNRCFLVVMNKSAEKQIRMPRIIPGILEAKWYDDKANGQTTVPAQGYLYLGGETVARSHKLFDTGIEWYTGEQTEEGFSTTNKLFARSFEGFRGTKFAYTDAMPGVSNFRHFYDNQRLEQYQGLPARLRKAVDDGELTYGAAIAKLDGASSSWHDLWNVNENPYNEDVSEGYVTRTAEFGIDDYWFTSCYLFGQYNQPAWNRNSIEEFADCWMNGAGFGKAGTVKGKYTACCGRGVIIKDAKPWAIKQLSGNLKAGIYLCTENGDDSSHAAIVQRTGILEDQLWLDVVQNSWFGVDEEDRTRTTGLDAEYLSLDGNWMTKQDIWADGNLDLATTDVGSGTWSIKATTALDNLIKDSVMGFPSNAWGYEFFDEETGKPYYVEDNRFKTPDLTLPLLCTIDAAMTKLDKTCKSGIKLFGNPVGNGEKAEGLIGYSFYKNYLAEDYEHRPIFFKKFVPNAE